MDMRWITDPDYFENLPDVKCTFCGWVGKAYEFPFVYGKPNRSRGRRVHSMCPECNTMDTGKLVSDLKEGFVPIKDGPLIKHRKPKKS